MSDSHTHVVVEAAHYQQGERYEPGEPITPTERELERFPFRFEERDDGDAETETETEEAETQTAPDADAEEDPDSESDAESESEASGAEEADAESESESEADGFPGDFEDAKDFVDRTPMERVINDLETGEYDAHLDEIETAADRQGVQDAIDERR